MTAASEPRPRRGKGNNGRGCEKTDRHRYQKSEENHGVGVERPVFRKGRNHNADSSNDPDQHQLSTVELRDAAPHAACRVKQHHEKNDDAKRREYHSVDPLELRPRINSEIGIEISAQVLLKEVLWRDRSIKPKHALVNRGGRYPSPIEKRDDTVVRRHSAHRHRWPGECRNQPGG